jgi:hypothetical protein
MVLFAAVCAAYAPVARGTFILDDEHFIQKNRWVQEARFDKIFSTSVTDGAGVPSNFYRPLQQSAFALVWRVFGENQTAYHVLSIGTHAVNAVLVWLLFERLGLSFAAAVMGAALWALHPVQSEAVAFVSGYADVLGVFWLLVAMLWVVSAGSRVMLVRVALIWCALLLAQVSKESLVVAAPCAWLLWWYGKKTAAAWCKTAFVAACIATKIAVVYLALKFTVFDFTKVGGLTGEHNVYTEHLWVRLWTFVHVIPEYVRLIVWPHELFYTKPYTAYVDWSAWSRACAGLCALAGIVGACACAYRYRVLVALGVAWCICAMLPYVGVVPLNAMHLEHWLYLPTIGVACAAAAFFDTEQVRTKVGTVALIVAMAVCVVCGIRTALRAAEWADYEKFYVNEIKHGGATAMVYNNLAMRYAEKNENAKAKEFYLKAAAAMPRPEPLYNLSSILINEREYVQAREALREALRRDPQFTFARERLVQLDAFMQNNGEKR